MKINGLPTALKFKKVRCPKCGLYCAMKFTGGSKKGVVECCSTDHIKPCNFFAGNMPEREVIK